MDLHIEHIKICEKVMKKIFSFEFLSQNVWEMETFSFYKIQKNSLKYFTLA